MTELIVRLEDGSNSSIIRQSIELLRGVKDVIIKSRESVHKPAGKPADMSIQEITQAIDSLSGALKREDIDWDDERTRYILGK